MFGGLYPAKGKQAGNDGLKVFRKVSPPISVDLNGDRKMAITLYERIGDIAFTVGVFAAKAYFAIALV